MVRHRDERRPKVSLLVGILCLTGLVVLYSPLVVMLTRSLSEASGWVADSGWTFQWYERLFRNRSLLPSFLLSLKIGLMSTGLSLVVGTWIAFVLVRSKGAVRIFLLTSLNAILVLPDLVLGIALLIWFSFCKVGLGALSMTLAHATFSVTYVVLSVASRLNHLDPLLPDAARALGASSWQYIRFVVFPWLKPAWGTAGFLAFTFSFDDFVLSFLLSDPSPQSQTLPLKLYEMARYGVTGELYALATVLLCVSSMVAVLVVGLDRHSKLSA